MFFPLSSSVVVQDYLAEDSNRKNNESDNSDSDSDDSHDYMEPEDPTYEGSG